MPEKLEPIKDPENETLPLNSGKEDFSRQEKLVEKKLAYLSGANPEVAEGYRKAMNEVREHLVREDAEERKNSAQEIDRFIGKIDDLGALSDLIRGSEPGPSLNEKILGIVNRLIENLIRQKAEPRSEGPLSTK
jgi:hypothetical protein